MQKLTGDQCPLLFGKWKPDVFQSFYENEGKIDQHYDFDFALVEIEAGSDYSIPKCFISGRSKTTWGKDKEDPDYYHLLFDNRILELYKDAKEFLKKKFEIHSVVEPQLKLLDVEKYSQFIRRTGLKIDVDYEKLNGKLNNIKRRNEIALEVYESLEVALKNEFGVKSEEILPNYLLWVRQGNQKILNLNNGIIFDTENPLEDKVNAGTLYMSAMVDETGREEDYVKTINFIVNHLNLFKGKLDNHGDNGCVHIGISGDGAYWRIDFSQVELPRRLYGTVMKALAS